MAGIEIPYPAYTVASSSGVDHVTVQIGIDNSSNVAPGVEDEILKAVRDTIAARKEVSGVTITRTDLTMTDVDLPS